MVQLFRLVISIWAVMASTVLCECHADIVDMLQQKHQLDSVNPLTSEPVEKVLETKDKRDNSHHVMTDHLPTSVLSAPALPALAPTSLTESMDLGTCILAKPEDDGSETAVPGVSAGALLLKAAVWSGCFAISWLFVICMWMSLRGSHKQGLSHNDSDGRLAFIDNAKFLMMVSVVFAHVECASHPLGFTFSMFPAFHMRGFCFLSGLVSKDALNLNKLIKLVIRLSVPFIFYSVIIDPMMAKVQSPEIQLDSHVLANLTLSHFHIGWYLVALVAWRLAGSLLHPLKSHRGMRFAIAMVFSFVGNHYAQAYLPYAWVSTASLFPVFVAGQICPLTWLSNLPPVGGASVILGSFLLALCLHVKSSQIVMSFESQIPNYGDVTIQGNHHFLQTSCGKWELLLQATSLFRNIYELSKALVILLCFCPRSRCFITEWGKNSIYPFLLQRVLLFQKWQYIEPLAAFSEQLLLGSGLLIYSYFWTAILASHPVRMIFGIFLEPVWLAELLGLQKASPEEESPDEALPPTK